MWSPITAAAWSPASRAAWTTVGTSERAPPAQPGTAKAPPPPPAPPAVRASPLALYQKSLDALRRKEHAEAIAGFRDLMKTYPKHALAENAQYWTGEAYYDQKSYAAALAEFRKLRLYGKDLPVRFVRGLACIKEIPHVRLLHTLPPCS